MQASSFIMERKACTLRGKAFGAGRVPCRRPVTLHSQGCRASKEYSADLSVGTVLSIIAGTAATQLLTAHMALAEFRLPPIDSDPNRCERGFVGNTIGQANAVSDKILDLRLCVYAGKDLHALVLSGALLADADMSNTNMQEAVLTKAYAVGTNLAGADMTNAVVDRVDFTKADLEGAKLINAVVTGSTFMNANLKGTNFEDALIGSEDVKRLCANPTLTGDSRLQVGCRN